MKRIYIVLALWVVALTTYAQTSTWVNGYFNQSGRFVEGYYRSVPGPKIATDVYGNGYSNPSNLNRDQDKDGRTGRYDNNDRRTPEQELQRQQLQQAYGQPGSTVAIPAYPTTPTFTPPATNYVGPRGGIYHITPSGRKSYH